jgi:hypothetical protein
MLFTLQYLQLELRHPFALCLSPCPHSLNHPPKELPPLFSAFFCLFPSFFNPVFTLQKLPSRHSFTWSLDSRNIPSRFIPGKPSSRSALPAPDSRCRDTRLSRRCFSTNSSNQLSKEQLRNHVCPLAIRSRLRLPRRLRRVPVHRPLLCPRRYQRFIKPSRFFCLNCWLTACAAQWCLAQTSSCPLLCYQVDDSGNEPAANVCDAVSPLYLSISSCLLQGESRWISLLTRFSSLLQETLVYNCTCSNGETPDSLEYSQTIPYFLCTERNTRCVEACGLLSSCASDCRQNNPCGATNPTRVTSAPGSSEPTATPSSTSSAGDTVHSGFASDGEGDEEEEDAGVRSLDLGIGRVYAVGVLVAGFIGGFAVLL